MIDAPALTLTPYIVVSDARAAIEFYEEAFGAKSLFSLVDPGDGKIGHAELSVAGGRLMIADEYPDFGALSPATLGGSPVKLHLYVDDVDAVFARALALGATETRPVKDEFYGDRVGSLTDPFGHSWMISTRKTEVSPEEMQRRWDEAMAG